MAESFGYDALNRLDTGSGDFGSRDYDYDKNGNRTRLDADSTITDYSYEVTPQTSNRMASIDGVAVTLDANGNTTHQGDWEYVYNVHNRLVQARENSLVKGDYRFNGLGQRVSKATGTTTLYRYGLNGELLAELDDTQTVTKEYIYLNGQPLAVIATETTVDPGGDETIIDNGDPGTSATGSWASHTSPKDYGADYLIADGGAGSSYRCTPQINAGSYEVFAWWVAKKKQSTNVPYTISHNGITDTVYEDQTQNGGQWMLLGVYDFIGDGSEYIEVTDANGKTTADAVRLVKQPSQQVVTNTYYIHNDHLGTPRAMSDSAGNLVWAATYDPYGSASINEDPDGNGQAVSLNLRFPGQYYDQETGLHYNYYRTYDPSTGRYLESDPIGLWGGLNTYAYALNNPLFWYDPTGLSSDPVLGKPINRSGPVDQSGRMPRTGTTIEGPYTPPKTTGEKIAEKIADRIVRDMIGIGGVVTKSPMTIFITGMVVSNELNPDESSELERFAHEEQLRRWARDKMCY